jgi:hypothetical protein
LLDRFGDDVQPDFTRRQIEHQRISGLISVAGGDETLGLRQLRSALNRYEQQQSGSAEGADEFPSPQWQVVRRMLEGRSRIAGPATDEPRSE